MYSLFKILLFSIFYLQFYQIAISQVVTWQKVLNKTSYSLLNKIQQTKDGGFIAIGTDIVGNYSKLLLIKSNYKGETEWTKYYDLNFNKSYNGYWIEEITHNGFIIAGSGDSKANLIKTDSVGNIIWIKTFNGYDLSQTKCIKEVNGNGFILLLRVVEFGSLNKISLIRTDNNGNILWTKIFGNENFDIFGNEIQYIYNVGFIICGYKWNNSNSTDLFLMKINLNGDSIWSRIYNEYSNSGGYSIDLTHDNGFIVAGQADSTVHNFPNSYIVKTDSMGNVEWSKRYSSAFTERCFSIRKLKSSGFVFCGTSDSTLQGNERAIIRVISNSGNILYEQYYSPAAENNRFNSVEVTNDNGFVICGYSDFGNLKGIIIKTDSTGSLNTVNIENYNETIKSFEIFQNYPNPFNSDTKIKYIVNQKGFLKINIFNLLGEEISTLVNNINDIGIYEIFFNPSEFNLTSGIYFYNFQFKTGNTITNYTKSLIYIK